MLSVIRIYINLVLIVSYSTDQQQGGPGGVSKDSGNATGVKFKDRTRTRSRTRTSIWRSVLCSWPRQPSPVSSPALGYGCIAANHQATLTKYYGGGGDRGTWYGLAFRRE